MSNGTPKDAARRRIAELVQHFRRNELDYLRAGYNETQARTDFITPLLGAFGWDVYNTKGLTLALREVLEEPTLEDEEDNATSRKPDYELRLARQRKIFIEAKKPHVSIDRDKPSAFQVRRYGYSGNLPISVLTNFHQLAVYDCTPAPLITDEAHVARIALFKYEEFETRFDELWDTLSREVVYSGDFDRRFSTDAPRRGAQPFDSYFLAQVRSWRYRLAEDIYRNNPSLTPRELTYAVQLFLARIVFLRICEDREIEKYEMLRSLDRGRPFEALMDVLKRADQFYDSGLFRLLDDAPLGIRISDGILRSVIAELYYPASPYTFAVIETEVLGQIYEQFLGEVIGVTPGGEVQVVAKPEVRASGGVVPTPRFLVDAIVARTLSPKLEGKAPDELVDVTVADICCGSGAFLLSAFEMLMEHYLSWYIQNDRANHAGPRIYEATAGQWRLTYEEKRRILIRHLRGVDIDSNAADVARFSLLLKLIEDERAEDLRDYVGRHRSPALPALDENIKSGNSLISAEEWAGVLGAMAADARSNINPFDWHIEFADDMRAGGFDVIVGNPPYIRIQNMAAYSPDEVSYYQAPQAPYSTGQQDNFDKYALFIERSLSLLKPAGRLGIVVPHKFMTIHSGRALRRLLSQSRVLEEIVHFGAKQVFGHGTANYTCILVIDTRRSDEVRIDQPSSIVTWRYGNTELRTIPASDLGEDPWTFASAETRALFDRLRAAGHPSLETVADIVVGVQTSADDVFIIHESGADSTTVIREWHGRQWQIEREILRPCLHDATIAPYARPIPNAWLIFPYNIEQDERGRSRARLIQPDELQRRFRLCWQYLNARRSELETRNVVGGSAALRQWYQYGRSQSLTKFDGVKIILPVLSLEPRYSYDDHNTMITAGGNGPYYMIRPENGLSIFYLLAVLHHPLTEAFVRTNTSTFRGGYYSHGKQFIKDLLIPNPSKTLVQRVDQLVQTIIERLDELRTARTPDERLAIRRHCLELRTEIEDLVSDAFSLSPEDVEIARSVPVPE